MVDHHVDRPGVKVEQSMQLTGPNHPIEFNTPPHQPPYTAIIHRKHQNQNPDNQNLIGWTTWWLWRGAYTRSHPELGRENPQRPWYCVLRHGRVGRRQVFQSTRLQVCTWGRLGCEGLAGVCVCALWRLYLPVSGCCQLGLVGPPLKEWLDDCCAGWCVL